MLALASWLNREPAVSQTVLALRGNQSTCYSVLLDTVGSTRGLSGAQYRARGRAVRKNVPLALIQMGGWCGHGPKPMLKVRSRDDTTR